jgi:3-deoxy-D-manno-octulosonic-acid transferase
MRLVWSVIYNVLVVPLLWVLVQLVSLVSPKTRMAIRGRRGLMERLATDVGKLKSRNRIWFHASSLGEFEQAKPIIAALRRRYADLDIIVSFFSPSGYEHSKAYKLASLITYLPFDTASAASAFLDLLRPTIAVMVRYDVWPNHVWQLARRGIPVYIANATLHRGSARLWPIIRNFHYHVYNHLTHILTVSDEDAETFRLFKLAGPHIEPIGDTRYDQVWQRSIEARTKHLIPASLLQRRKVFVVGSSWQEDEDVVLPAFLRLAQEDETMVMILVPHEPTLETLERLEAKTNHHLRFIRFSDLNDYAGENVILVDSIGILMPLYQYAYVAYVGGSFRQGVHNVLEPAVYGVPILFGPRHENSQEAIALVRRTAAFVVRDQENCYSILRRLLENRHERLRAGKEASRLVKENIGATERCITHLDEVLRQKKRRGHT